MHKKKLPKTGLCKLTGERGKLVRSHIIPRALSKPRQQGSPFAQIGNRQRPQRRFDSWYDPNLVTEAGEKILTDYDTWAIRELRALKLVWQSWGPMRSLSVSDFKSLHNTNWGIRIVKFSNSRRMRMFLLSLLWRAAATDRPEFREVDIKPSALRKLRRYLRDGILPPNHFFPATLTQISTMGFMHNHAPIADNKKILNLSGSVIGEEPIFRFYFDGLIVHFHTKPSKKTMIGIEPMIVGHSEGTVVSTVTFNQSWQFFNFQCSIEESEFEFPGEFARAEGR